MLERIVYISVLRLYLWICATDPSWGNEMGKQSDRPNNSGNDNVNFQSKLISMSILAILELMQYLWYWNTPLRWFDYILFISATIGMIIRLWAYRELGRFYTFAIGIRKNHQIIQTGPYKYVTHPGYTGQILIMVSAILAYQLPWLILISVMCYIVYRFYHRIDTEEDMMIRHFGNEYYDYAKNKYRLIPHII